MHSHFSTQSPISKGQKSSNGAASATSYNRCPVGIVKLAEAPGDGSPREVSCPTCLSLPGERCRDVQGHTLGWVHEDRRLEAALKNWALAPERHAPPPPRAQHIAQVAMAFFASLARARESVMVAKTPRPVCRRCGSSDLIFCVRLDRSRTPTVALTGHECYACGTIDLKPSCLIPSIAAAADDAAVIAG
jgi:hypothetical protein